MQSSIVSALLFGASGGLSPGPLLMLLIAETLRHGLRAGFMVAAAPLVSDLPIVVVSVMVLAQVSHQNVIMGAISFAGAVLLLLRILDFEFRVNRVIVRHGFLGSIRRCLRRTRSCWIG